MMNDEKYTLWLVGRSAWLVDNTLTLQQRQDALDTALYAQLRADKRSDGRASDHGQWFEVYQRSLTELGWITLQRHRERTAVEADLPASLEPMQAWLANRDPSLSRELDAAVQALASKTARRHLGRFQPAQPHELGVVSRDNVIAMCSLHYETIAATRRQSLGAWVGCVDEQAFAFKREALRALIESKCSEDHFTYVGKLAAGGVHGQV